MTASVGKHRAEKEPSGDTSSLLASILNRSGPENVQSALQAFLNSETIEQSLSLWFRELPTEDEIVLQLEDDIARIDELLQDQVNAILHHPAYQRLEASWRGLHYLVEQADPTANLHVRVLSVTWKELSSDADRALEFDQSQLFRKVYSNEFGTPGGRPFGLLLGDYEVAHRINPVYRTDDVATLTSVSQTAAAAFAPFVVGGHPSLFGLDSFVGLQRPFDLSKTFDQIEYLKWRTFRAADDARFVGLTLPRVLMRAPYGDDPARTDFFRFVEQTETIDDYLWGTAVYAFGAVVARAFSQSDWPADIRGVETDVEGGGLVEDLASHYFETDRCDAARKCSTDIRLTDTRERELAEIGLIPLTRCRETDLYAFYSTPSIQRPKAYDRKIASANARISSMLQYMLCVSRFAHYIKVIGRERVGSFADAEDAERLLNDWLSKYVTQSTDPSIEVRARYPLREAAVQVREMPGRPGSYGCIIHLRPHFQLEDLDASVKLTTELVAASV